MTIESSVGSRETQSLPSGVTPRLKARSERFRPEAENRATNRWSGSAAASRVPMAITSPLPAKPKSSHAAGLARGLKTERQRIAAVVGSGVPGGLDGSVLGWMLGTAAALGDGLGPIEAGASVATAMLCGGAKVGGDSSEQPASSAAQQASA